MHYIFLNDFGNGRHQKDYNNPPCCVYMKRREELQEAGYNQIEIFKDIRREKENLPGSRNFKNNVAGKPPKKK